jgi:UDP-N-acetylmuramyl pentapeptide synthase
MIELGKKQYDFNFEAAKKAAKIADIFVVVGETNKKALLDGARSIKNKKVKIVELGKNENLEEKIMSFFSPPSVILIENELPDHYF